MDTLEGWLTSTQKQRDALFEHSKSKIPNDKGLLDQDIEKSIRAAEAAGAQLAQVRYYLTGALAGAFEQLVEKKPELKGAGRELMVKDMTKDIQLLHDQIENLAKSLNSRVKVECNGRRSLL